MPLHRLDAVQLDMEEKTVKLSARIREACAMEMESVISVPIPTPLKT
jgi:hypothetical protein